MLAFLSGHEHAFHEARLHPRGGPWLFIAAPALAGRWWQGDRPWGPAAFAPGWLKLTLDPADADNPLRAVFVEALPQP